MVSNYGDKENLLTQEISSYIVTKYDILYIAIAMHTILATF